MKSVGVYEAKTHLAKLLEDAERGDTITITRHGREVARLVPAASGLESPELVIGALREARRGVRRGRRAAPKMISEGRR